MPWLERWFDLWDSVVGAWRWLLLDPYSEACWMYWASSLGLAFAVYLCRTGSPRQAAQGFWRDLLPRGPHGRRAVWADLQYFSVNALLLQAVQAPLLLLLSATDVSVRSALDHVLGPVAPLQGSAAQTVAVIAVSLAGFAAADLAFYAVHRAFHQVPLLWEFHKMHHAPQELWFLTNFRDHPVDSIPYRLAETVWAGVAVGTLGHLLGLDEQAALLDGYLLMAFYAAGRMLGHSRLWLHFGRRLNHVLNSPSHHQLHHSTAPDHLNKNFGSNLALWDWCFGTLVVPAGKPQLVFGLAHESSQRRYDDTLVTMYLTPFAGAWARLGRSWRRAPASERPTQRHGHL